MINKICAAPWSHLMIESTGQYYSCWASSSSDGKSHSFDHIQSSAPKEAWNSEYLKQLRKTFLLGLTPLQCKQCFELEHNGLKSDRTENFGMSDEQLNERVAQTNKDGELAPRYLDSLELQLTNLCNFACRTCGIHNSSSWARDYVFLAGKKPESIMIKPFKDSQEISNKLELHLESCRRVYFIGGEPLIQPEHYHILDKLLKYKNNNCEINYTTNLSTLSLGKKHVDQYWNKFKDIKLTVSLDGLNSKGEYIREGFKWEKFQENLDYVKNNHPHIKIRCNITVSLLNILDLKEIIDYCLHNHIEAEDIKLGPVKEPLSYSITLLPKNSKEKIESYYQQAYDNNHPMTHELLAIIEYMNSKEDNSYEHYFFHLNDRLDMIRGQNLEEITKIKDYF